jgi:hypothetical protein
MPSPRIAVAVAALAVAFSAAPAVADDTSTALAACRTAVGAEFGVEPGGLQIERIDSRGRTVRVRLEARKDGDRVGVADCTYVRRGGATTVAVIQSANGQAAASSTPTAR